MCLGESDANPRKYTDEFKREAVRLATAPGNSIAGVAIDLGADHSVVADWVKEFQGQRCLKRYIVRELYPLILADLRAATTAF